MPASQAASPQFLGLRPTPVHPMTGLMRSATVILTTGFPQSNHCAITAVTAKHFPAVKARRNYHIDGSQLGEGYGVPTAAGQQAARLAAGHDGILLDPPPTTTAAARPRRY